MPIKIGIVGCGDVGQWLADSFIATGYTVKIEASEAGKKLSQGLQDMARKLLQGALETQQHLERLS
jgi:predicted dinucleotide-binding enzyme